MMPNRRRDFLLDSTAVLLLVPLLLVPFVTSSPLFHSLTYQVAIGVSAAMGVYIMLRMGLLSFTVPAFMAIGGYAAAMLAKSGTTELLLLMGISILAPCVVAIPLGALVLRLKGVYFIFITFIFNEILQLVLFETPTLTGGSNGIAGVPPASLFGMTLGKPATLVAVTVFVCIAAAGGTLIVTQRFRPEFTAIEENETLAESLGVAVWKFRTIGFVVSAGVCGLAGFALVNMLSTAHPSSFASWSVNSYIAYVFVGGRSTLLGVVVGSALLIVMMNVFSSYADLSAGLFGILLVAVMMIAPGGIVGSCMRLWARRRQRDPNPVQPQVGVTKS
ncbi:MAG: branched-chain amino acid ABC transporter permease [Pseudomonadota bacterium]